MERNKNPKGKTSNANQTNLSRKFKFETFRKCDGGGIRTSLHGIVYQINLLMLFMKRGLQHRYNFSLGTEIDAAHKFDDLIFEYENVDGSIAYRFLQAKHKQDNSRKITEAEVMNETGGDFSVLKYFISYRSIKNAKRNFFKGEYQDFIVCTNIDIDSHIAGDFDELTDTDPLIGFSENICATRPKRLIFKNETVLYEQLVQKLLTINPDHHIIVQKIGATVGTSKVIVIEKLFKDNRSFLMHRIFDQKTMQMKGNRPNFKFSQDFLNPKEEDMKNYNKIFINAYIDKNPDILSEIHNSTIDNEDERIQLLQDVIENKLKNESFEIARSFVNLKTKDKNEQLSRDEIEAFLNKFVFAVNQPTEDELSRIVLDEIGEYMNVGDSELAASKLLACILDWASEKKGSFIKSDQGHKFFADVEYQILYCRQIGFALTNKLNIDKYSCSFKNDHKTVTKINNFLQQQQTDQVLLLYTDCQLLTEIKLMQLKQASKADEFMYSHMKVLVNQVDTEVCPIKAFRSRACNQLFITVTDHSELDDKAEQMLKTLFKIALTTRKIIMLIPLKLRDIFEDFADDILRGVNYVQVKDTESKFTDLSPESQDKLLNEAKVKFQGCEVPLRELLDEELKSTLVNDVLSQLVLSREFKVDVKEVIDQYYDTAEYYIDRYLNRLVLISNDVLDNQKFLITYDGQETHVKTGQEIIFISESEDDFQSLCLKYKRPIHWLKTENKELIWHKSQGLITNIRKHVRIVYNGQSKQKLDEEESYLVENVDVDSMPKDLINKIFPQTEIFGPNKVVEHPSSTMKITNVSDIKHEGVVIITAEPGMGKSTFLSHVATQSRNNINSKAVIKVSLLDYVDELDELQNKTIGDEDAIQFLYRMTGLEANEVSKRKIKNKLVILNNGKLDFQIVETFIKKARLINSKLFTYLYNERKLVILLDGFDEIVPHYKEQALHLLQALDRTRVCAIWVTTRPYNIINDLEVKLNTFSYQLDPLSSSEQTYCLHKFWTTRLNTVIDIECVQLFIQTYIAKALRHIAITEDKNQSMFMGNPQHVFMVATIYEQDFERYNNEDKVFDFKIVEEVTLYKLYSIFFKIKFKALYEEINMKDPKYRDDYEEKFRERMLRLQKLALMELFPKEVLPEELVPKEDRDKLVDSVMTETEKTGLVARVTRNGTPQFVHRTFAEFFAADLLGDVLLSKSAKIHQFNAAKDFLYRFLTGPAQPSSIITFLNYKIVSVDKNADIFNAAIGLDFRKLPPFDKCSQLRDCFGRSPIHLMFCSGKVNTKYIVQEKTLNDLFIQDDLFKWTPVHYGIACHNCHYIDCFNRKTRLKEKSQIKDDHGITPYILAARRGCTLNCVMTFLQELPLCVDVQDNEFGKTALHYALDRTDHDGQQLASYLIMRGANITVPDKEGKTPFHIIIKQKKYRSLTALTNILFMKQNTNNTLKTEFMESISTDEDFCVSLLAQNLELTEVLLENTNLDVNLQDSEGKTALHYAFQNLHNDGSDTVPYLIKKGANILLPDNAGNLPSHYNYQVMMKLFVKGYSPKVFSYLDEMTANYDEEMRPFILTMRFDNNIIVHILSRYAFIAEIICENNPPVVNTKDRHGKTALHLAVMWNAYKVVGILLINNACPNICDNDGKSPLEYLKTNKDNDDEMYRNVEKVNKFQRILIYLLKYGAYFNVDTDLYARCEVLTSIEKLFDAVKRNVIQEVVSILSDTNEAQVVVNARSRIESMSPLHYAVLGGNQDMIKILLSYGAFFTALDANNRLPRYLTDDRVILNIFDLAEKLFTAVQNSSEIEVQDYIEQGAIVNAGYRNGQMMFDPLCLALQHNSVEVIKLLLNNGAKTNVRYFDDSTPLHIACQSGGDNMKALLEFCHLDEIYEMFLVKNFYQRNPLDNAMLTRNITTIKMLLDKCKFYEHDDKYDREKIFYVVQTSWHFAKRSKDEEIMKVCSEYLKKCGHVPIPIMGPNPFHKLTKYFDSASCSNDDVQS